MFVPDFVLLTTRTVAADAELASAATSAATSARAAAHEAPLTARRGRWRDRNAVCAMVASLLDQEPRARRGPIGLIAQSPRASYLARSQTWRVAPRAARNRPLARLPATWFAAAPGVRWQPSGHRPAGLRRALP